MAKRKLIVQLSDLHSGHTFGLLNPDTKLDEIDMNGDARLMEVKLNNTQKYLWHEVYLPAINQTIEYANGDEIILLLTGDLFQGSKFPFSTNVLDMADQITVAQYNLKPWLQHENVKTIRIATGTPVHDFGNDSGTRIITQMLKSELKNVDITIVHHGLLEIDGVLIDYAHHGPFGGSRNWLRGNEARYYLRSIVMDDIQAGIKPPNLILRGHYHIALKEYLSFTIAGQEHEAWIVICPALCLIDGWVRRITKNIFMINNGIVLFEIRDGDLQKPKMLVNQLDLRRREKID